MNTLSSSPHDNALGPDFTGLEARDLVRLHELSTRLLRDCPLPALLEDVLRASLALLDADLGNVQLYDRASQSLRIVAHVGFRPEFLAAFKSVDGEIGACGAAMQRMQRVIVEDVETDPLFLGLREAASAAGFRAVQSTPLRSGSGRLLGVLSTHFRTPHRPSQLQLRLLDLYAQQAERVIERKQSEEALRQKERELRLITSSAPVTLAHLNRNLVYKFVNEAYARRFGRTPDYFIGRSVVDVHGDAVNAIARPCFDRVFRGESFETDMEVNYPELGRRLLRTGWVPERDDEGNVVGCVTAVTDITERAQVEAALRASDERLKAVLEAGRMGWWDLDVATGTMSCSSTCKVNFGIPAGKPFTYEDFARAVHPEDFAHWQSVVKESIAHGTGFAVEYRNVWPDGSIHWVSIRGDCTVDASGRTTALSGVSIDVSQRKAAEETATRFQLVVENSTEFIGICDLVGRPYFVNRAALQMIGLENLEALQRLEVKDFFFPEDQAFIRDKFFPRVLRDGFASVEIRFRHFQTGEALWMNYNVVVLLERGEPTGFGTISQNITERKRAEAKLRESEDRNRTLVESLPQLVWTATAEGACDYISPQWVNYTGIPAADQLDAGWLNQVHPADFARIREAWTRSVQSGQDYNVEYRLRRADGQYHWFAVRSVPLRSAGGEIVKWFGTNTDIDERRRNEAQIRESRERLEAALSASRTGTFRWNIKSNELDWDDELDRLFGLTPGKSARSLSQFVELVHPDDRARVIAACERCAQYGADFHEEFRVVWPSGAIHWLDDKGRTFFDHEARPAYMTGACVDITTRKLADEELREARNRLQQHADQLESKVEERTASLRQAVAQMEEFSYSVSHDLRAPLRAMTQYARLLAEDFGPVLGETGLHYVNRILRSSERMNQLTLDTLTLSKITRGPVTLGPISLDTLVADIVAENATLQPPRTEIELVSPLGIVDGHASLLTQAISNLLVNAAKFVPAGRTPQIRIWTEASDGFTRLLVRDNGIGVAPELQHRLFGIFQRMHPEANYEGTGIGLAIVRKAVERMGGTVGMTSDGRNGSTFWMQLARPRG